jgi:hypothetical protein
LSETRRKFFLSVNSILSKTSYANDIVKLQLVESHCLPVLLYAIESFNLSNIQLKEINSWWNSVFRKIFQYNKWESVRELICLLGRLDIVHLENLRRVNFIKKMSSHFEQNVELKQLLIFCLRNSETTAVLRKFNINLMWSFAKIKAIMHISLINSIS